MPAHRSPARPLAVAVSLAAAALTGCVDTGVRLFEIDAAAPPSRPDMRCVELSDCDGDGGPLPAPTPDADMLPSGRFDAGLDAARPDAGPVDMDLDGSPDLAPDMRLPDMRPPDMQRPDMRPADMRLPDMRLPDMGPLGPPCSLGCDGAETLAAYVPLDRLDLVHRLDDGALLLGGMTRDGSDLQRLGRGMARAVAVGQAPLDPASRDQVVLLHVDEALDAVTQVYAFSPGLLGPLSRAADVGGHLYVSTRYSMAADQAGRLGRPPLGYAVARFDGIPAPPAAPVVQALWLLGADGYARTAPAWDAVGPSAVLAADGAGADPGDARLHIVAPNGIEQVVRGWRFHTRAVMAPGAGVGSVYGPLDDDAGGIGGSFVPLTPDQCPLRTWYAPGEVGGGEDPSPSERRQRASEQDGNGDRRPGTEPHDAFGSRPCVAPADGGAPPRPDDSLITLNGWRLDPGQRFDVVAALRDDDGAMYVALNATASTQEADDDINDDHVPTVLRFDAGGALRWWQRLHGQQGGGWKNSSVDQRIVDLALAPGGGVVVLARSLVRPETLDEPQLWDALYAFQEPPVGGDGVPVGWLGVLDADSGELEHSTYVFDPVRDAPERLDAPLDCWPDTYDLAAAAFEPARGGLAVSDNGVIALHGITHRARTTLDALTPTGRDVPTTPMPVVRAFDAGLETVLHSSVIVGDVDAPDPSAEVTIRDIAFDGRGRVIVVGDQVAGAPPLPTRQVPGWAARNPVNAQTSAARATTAFIVRLDLDPGCDDGNGRDAMD